MISDGDSSCDAPSLKSARHDSDSGRDVPTLKKSARHDSDSGRDAPTLKKSARHGRRRTRVISDSDSDMDAPSLKKSARRDSNNSECDSKSKKITRRQWFEYEKSVFKKNIACYVDKKVMPPRHVLDRVVKRLGTRTIAQVRVRANNCIMGKQELY